MKHVFVDQSILSLITYNNIAFYNCCSAFKCFGGKFVLFTIMFIHIILKRKLYFRLMNINFINFNWRISQSTSHHFYCI